MNHPRTFVISGPWRQAAWERQSKHLTERGIPHELFVGLDTDTCGVDHTASPFVTLDGRSLHPDGKTVYHHGRKVLVCCIRTLMFWKAMQYVPEDVIWGMDDDAEFTPDWKEKYDAAMAVLPDDWDVVVLGHCCCKGKPARHVGNNLYEIKYPLGCHVLQIRKKALPLLTLTHMRMWAPMDIAMEYESFPKLRVYTVYPRISGQRGVILDP